MKLENINEFTHMGLPCRVKYFKWEVGSLNIPGEHYCGYVGIDKNHPLYEDAGDAIDVFGGVTYSAKEDGLWWFGFDSTHPYSPLRGNNKNGLWTEEEATEETKYLAEQLSQWNLMNLLK